LRPDYCVVNNVITKENCDLLIEWSAKNSTRAKVHRPGLDLLKRRSAVAWIPNGSEFQEIIEEILKAFCHVSESMFNHSVDSIEPIQLATYGIGDHYGWHMDAGLTGEDRVISASVELDDPSSFKGGGLEFQTHPVPIPEKQQGRMIMFPSMLVHRARPIYWGKRRSLVIWAK